MSFGSDGIRDLQKSVVFEVIELSVNPESFVRMRSHCDAFFEAQEDSWNFEKLKVRAGCIISS